MNDADFWEAVRSNRQPSEGAQYKAFLQLCVMKSRAEELNTGLKDAILLVMAGWEPIDGVDERPIFSWKWRRPGPRGGKTFQSTGSAMNQLRLTQAPLALEAKRGIEVQG